MAMTRLGYLAAKRQSTYNVAVVPTHFLRFKDGDHILKQDIIANNPIQNNRWNALNAVTGKATAEGSFNIDLDANECIHWISAALGSMTSTDISSATDASVYSHVITIASTLPYLTVEQGKGNLTDTTNNRQNLSVERAFGVMVDSFTLKASDGIVNLEVKTKAHGFLARRKMIAAAAAGSSVPLYLSTAEGFVATTDTVNIYDETPQNEAKAIASLSLTANTITIATLSNSYTMAKNPKVELTPLTPSYSTAAKVFTFNHVNFQFGADLTAAASAGETNIEDWEFSFMNNLEERFGSLRQTPSVIAPKGAKATLKFSKYFENVDDRDRWLNQAKRACIITICNNEIVSATDTNNAKYTFKIELDDIRYNTYEMPTGTDELYAYSVECEAYYDTSDGRAVRFTGINAKAGTEYTA